MLGAIGVSLGPFIASAGVIGLGISFGAQSIFKDMLTGIFILIEDQYSVGDTIKIASLHGHGRRPLAAGDAAARRRRHALHRAQLQITTVSNLSRDFSVGVLNVSVDAREDPDRVVGVLQQVVHGVRTDEAFKDIIIADPVDAPEARQFHQAPEHRRNGRGHQPAGLAPVRHGEPVRQPRQ